MGRCQHKIGMGVRGATIFLSLALAPQLTAAITISPEYLGSTTAGKPFSATLSATGGAPPYTFRIVGGSLPLGIELTGATLAGTPPSSIYGLWDFTVEARDAAGNAGTTDCYMKVFPSDLALSNDSLPSGSVGAVYSVTLAVTGGVGPRIFKVESGALPPGVSLAPGTVGVGGLQWSDNNVIKGTPTAKGTYSFVLRVSDYFGRTATFPLSITIGAAGEVPLGVKPSSVPAGAPGAAYAPVTFTGEGGVGDYTLTLKGSLPKGMTFANGKLSGTPAADSSGSYPFVIEVRDGAGAVAGKSYSLIVSNLAVLPSTLEAGTAGEPYAATTFTGSGGTGGHTFSLKGSLPAGMTFVDGTLSGTPSSDSAGSYSLTVEVRDSAGAFASQPYVLTIKPDLRGGGPVLPLSLSAPNLNAAVGGQLQVALWAAGGRPPYVFSVAAGELPPGVTLSADGMLSGSPTQQGLFRFTLSIQDATGNAPATGAASIFVAGALEMTSTTLPALTHNAYYAAIVFASGGVPPYTWMITSGSLPPGLTLNWLTGLISGTFTSSGYYRFTVRVSDATAAVATAPFTLGYDGTPPSITTDSVLPAAPYNRPYTVKLAALSSNLLIWSLESGALPEGLTLSPAGELSGVTGALGVHVFTVRVTDPGRRTDSRELSLTVVPPVTIKTSSPLPDASLGVATTTFQAAGGVPPYTWSVVGGSLPPGFALSATGVLSGTTYARGPFFFGVAVTDGADGRSTVPFSITVAPALALPPATLPRGRSDTLYSATLQASGGTPPYRWSATGLPPEFSLDPAGGILSGTPTGAQQIECTVTVTDQKGSSVSRPFSILVEAGPLILSTKALPDGAPGEPYTVKLIARSGTKPYSWSVIVGLTPSGLRLAPDGTLSGVTQEMGTFTFTVAVVDAQGAFVRGDLVLRVMPTKLVVTTTSLPDATAGVGYSARFAARGGATPYGWSIIAGLAPAGLRLAPDGTLSGVTSDVGTHTFSVAVVDAISNLEGTEVELRVSPAKRGVPGVATLPATAPPAAQFPVEFRLDDSLRLPATVTLELSFDGLGADDDPAVQFSTGGRTARFALAARTEGPVSIQTGSTAGVLTLKARIAAAGQEPLEFPPVETRIEAAPPVIERVDAIARDNAIEVSITGFSTTHEVSAATFGFELLGAGGVRTGEIRLPVSEDFRAWFDSPGSRGFGGQFTWRRNFAAEEAGAIRSVRVSLENRVGRSAPSRVEVRSSQ